MITDVIIIGGGASGLCAAISIKQKNPSLSVKIFERLPRVGKKLSTTGNGRCNISNNNYTISNYHGADRDFCLYALTKYNYNFIEKFFYNLGVPFVLERNKAYPASLQASSVVDCMRFAAEESGVQIYTDTLVTNIQSIGKDFKIICGNLSFVSKNIIIATGLLSGGDKLGCDTTMLSILQKSGFKTVNTSPAIVQLKTGQDIVKQLKGIKINATVSLTVSNKIIRSEYGETLFCDYGLSGPPILQISREVMRTKEDCYVNLDLFPNIKFQELFDILYNRTLTLKSRKLEEFFTGMLNKRLGQVILKLSGLKISDNVSVLNSQDIKKVVSILKKFSFKIIGTTGYNNSQVTAGGLSTSQFNSKTMMYNNCKGIYAIGEILDIDGDCGGYNLQWAWSSALCAADSILQENKNDNNK